MPGMLAEVRQALRWLVAKAQALGFDEKRIVLAGHSAGAQLLCMAMDEVRARAGIAISGLYDLEPIRLCYLNDKLRLTPACVKLFSPASHVRAGGPRLIVTVGAGELPELVRQSADYAAACGDRAQYLPLAGHDHFSVLDELAAFEGRLCQLLVPLAAQTRSKTR
jgi:arylformamidase